MEMKGVWSPITYYNLFFITFLCSAVKDDSTVVFVDYKGTDGFKVYTLPLAWSTHLQRYNWL